MTTSGSLLNATGLAKSFGAIKAVKDISFEVKAGEIVVVLGPNGAGKTTTVEICEGLTRPDQGTVRLFGLDPIEQADAVKARIGVMLQGGGGYPGARCGEMLELVASYFVRPLDTQWLLEVLGLASVRKVSYRRLSGGQQQRLALACALVGRPELIFLDEPTAGLDITGRRMVWELIERLKADGVGVLLTTHLMDEAQNLADRIIIIDQGIIVAEGSVDELTHSGADNQLRFTAPGHLNIELLRSALPENYQVSETSPGKYLVAGEITPQVLATITAFGAQSNKLITDLKIDSQSLEEVFLSLTDKEKRM